jgi:PAS domain S-box-containing protein
MPSESDRLEQFDLLLENAREYAIFTMGPDARITLWNAGAERILKWREEEAVGQPGAIIFTPEQRAAGVPEVEMEKAKRDGEASDERWHVRRDGSRFWAKGVMTSLYDDAGRLRGFAKILRDGTREKQHQEDIERLNRMLESRVAQRTEQVRALAASLADAEDEHRRRTAAVLHDDVQQRLYGIELALADLVRAAERGTVDRADLAGRAQEVLDWSAETLAVTRRLAVDLDPVREDDENLPDALARLARQTERLHGFALSLELDDALALDDPTTRTFALQAVRELVFNAVKHAGTDGARLEARPTGPSGARPAGLALTVADDGRGFDPSAETDTLGLRSVRDRLRLVGGHLELDAASGAGTRATAWVPMSEPGTASPESAG